VTTAAAEQSHRDADADLEGGGDRLGEDALAVADIREDRIEKGNVGTFLRGNREPRPDHEGEQAHGFQVAGANPAKASRLALLEIHGHELPALVRRQLSLESVGF